MRIKPKTMWIVCSPEGDIDLTQVAESPAKAWKKFLFYDPTWKKSWFVKAGYRAVKYFEDK